MMVIFFLELISDFMISVQSQISGVQPSSSQPQPPVSSVSCPETLTSPPMTSPSSAAAPKIELPTE